MSANSNVHGLGSICVEHARSCHDPTARPWKLRHSIPTAMPAASAAPFWLTTITGSPSISAAGFSAQVKPALPCRTVSGSTLRRLEPTFPLLPPSPLPPPASSAGLSKCPSLDAPLFARIMPDAGAGGSSNSILSLSEPPESIPSRKSLMPASESASALHSRTSPSVNRLASEL